MNREFLESLGLGEEVIAQIMTAFEGYVAEQETAFEQRLAAATLQTALDEALVAGGVHDAKAVRPFLDLEKISYENGVFGGLEEQLEALREKKSFLFRDSAQGVSVGKRLTGMSHSGYTPMTGAAMTDAQFYAKFGG